MIRIAIVEDEKKYISVLQGYLEQYEEEHHLDFQISIFYDGLDIVSDYTSSFDIILLDIQMKHLDGMKTAEKIRQLDEDVVFVFITSTVQYAVQGYMVDALGYVLKPVPYIAFSKILEKAVKQVQQKQIRHYITVEVAGGHLRMDSFSIYYIESQRHNLLIHSQKGDFITAGPMKKIEAELAPKGFSKCHNAYLVNLHHVNGVLQNNVLLPDETQLPVSRARKKSFMNDLTGFIGRMSR